MNSLILAQPSGLSTPLIIGFGLLFVVRRKSCGVS